MRVRGGSAKLTLLSLEAHDGCLGSAKLVSDSWKKAMILGKLFSEEMENVEFEAYVVARDKTFI